VSEEFPREKSARKILGSVSKKRVGGQRLLRYKTGGKGKRGVRGTGGSNGDPYALVQPTWDKDRHESPHKGEDTTREKRGAGQGEKKGRRGKPNCKVTFEPHPKSGRGGSSSGVQTNLKAREDN